MESRKHPLQRQNNGYPGTAVARTAAEGIPEGFRQARPGRVAPGGAQARSLSPARNESARYRNPLEILKSLFFGGFTKRGNPAQDSAGAHPTGSMSYTRVFMNHAGYHS